MFDCLIEEHDLVSIVVTKTKIFVTFVTDEGEEEVMKALLVNFKKDFNFRHCEEKLILVKSNVQLSIQNRGKETLKISVNL
jgi:hypothetical protein